MWTRQTEGGQNETNDGQTRAQGGQLPAIKSKQKEMNVDK